MYSKCYIKSSFKTKTSLQRTFFQSLPITFSHVLLYYYLHMSLFFVEGWIRTVKIFSVENNKHATDSKGEFHSLMEMLNVSFYSNLTKHTLKKVASIVLVKKKIYILTSQLRKRNSLIRTMDCLCNRREHRNFYE